MRNRFHSLCPYFAMFPESFVERWVGELTRPGDVVLDPFCGRGTTPFQSLLMDREAIACDVNDVAFCVTKAKTCAPRIGTVADRIHELNTNFDARQWWKQASQLPEFFQHAFSRRTLQQLCYLRGSLRWRRRQSDTMVAALVLGSLHGEMDKSNAYLSNQMPRTISTKPDYSIRFWKERELLAPERDVFEVIASRADFRYLSMPPTRRATVLHKDMRELPNCLANQRIRCVITSPPYLDVTNFEEDQWLRLWFLGGPDRPVRRRLSRDDRHTSAKCYWDFIADMWRSLGAILSRQSNVVIRIGSRSLPPERLLQTLKASTVFCGRKFELVSHEISELRNRQTDAFRPGSRGCLLEVDAHFLIR